MEGSVTGIEYGGTLCVEVRYGSKSWVSIVRLRWGCVSRVCVSIRASARYAFRFVIAVSTFC